MQAFPSRDFGCDRPLGPPASYQYTVTGSVALAAPAGRVLIRRPNSFAIRQVAVPIALNPGATSTEVRCARGGVIGADGAISGPSDQGFVDSTNGVVPLRLDRPGRWVVVARAKGFASTGDYFTPWSAPVTIRAVAPFDLDRVTFPDARGPHYQLRGEIEERTARGRVAVSIAPGRRGPFRSLGSARIRSNGTFVTRFTQRRARAGSYRIRYRFRGSATTAGGAVTQRVTITRRVFFG